MIAASAELNAVAIRKLEKLQRRMESENLNLGKISLWAKAVDSNVSKPGHIYMEVYNGSKALQREK
jgi:hypothetical protein